MAGIPEVFFQLRAYIICLILLELATTEEGVHLITYYNLILVHTYGFSSTEYFGVQLYNRVESSKRMHYIRQLLLE